MPFSELLLTSIRYSGMAITWDQRGCEQPIHVSGRVVIDTDAFNRFSRMRARSVDPFKMADISEIAQHTESKRALEEEGKKKIMLTPYFQMLCTPRLRGYSIKLKKWLDFFVDNVSEIEWNTNAFDSLVLPEDQKDLILSFTESQVINSAGFDDVIQGKGKGIVILLSGSPGIGKTLTAEAVAESMRVPLHTITSGELGSEAWSLESQLSNVLGIVAQWNAILLLDEADVFLEARSAHDLKRNQIVSIFLRTLEYYEGILFMTTNRVNNIDEAFQSRIHVSLEYPNLNDVSRRQIWTNIANTREHAFSETDFDELATVDLNGRQIKNVLKTAHLLASRRKAKLNREAVNVVLAIEKRRPRVGNNLS
jgi:ATP-dependent 26S proteasome regulatory subunit